MKKNIYIHIYFFFKAWQPLMGQRILTHEASRSHSDTPHSVGLLWNIILWEHRRICSPSLAETSLCGAWLICDVISRCDKCTGDGRSPICTLCPHLTEYIATQLWALLYYITLCYVMFSVLFSVMFCYVMLYYILILWDHRLVMLCYIILYCNLLGPPSYTRSVVDRNVVMRRIPVLISWHYDTLQVATKWPPAGTRSSGQHSTSLRHCICRVTSPRQFPFTQTRTQPSLRRQRL